MHGAAGEAPGGVASGLGSGRCRLESAGGGRAAGGVGSAVAGGGGPDADADAEAEAEAEPDAAQTAEANEASAGSTAAPFRCLGYNAEAFYYHSCRSGQVLRLSRSSHTATHLVALAPLPYWETLYPNKRGVNWSVAASDLHERSIQAGLFCPERIRGRGAWWGGGRPLSAAAQPR